MFLPYLWGMETFLNLEPISLVNSSYRTYEEWKRDSVSVRVQGYFGFLPYLWGMETLEIRKLTKKIVNVLTVPMRNGNSFSYTTRASIFSVLTVPMRNGNSFVFDKWVLEHFLVLTVPMRNGNFLATIYEKIERITVLTVPMRNGNFQAWGKVVNTAGVFLPYLWGMETQVLNLTLLPFILFLPYLWGMETLYGILERFVV